MRYATIWRTKIYPVPGSNYRRAFTYVYTVTDQDRAFLVQGTDTLADAVSRAKRAGIKDIRRAWETR